MTFSEVVLAFGLLQILIAVPVLAYVLTRYGMDGIDQIGKIIRRIFG